MIKFENTDIVGFEPAVRGMRNSHGSWHKSDSSFGAYIKIGPNDLNLMKKLAVSGTDESKFLRMITVYVDITAPLYWWKQFDTYKVGTVSNSTSTMHSIAKEEFKLDDFSTEHMTESALYMLKRVISDLNSARFNYIQGYNKQYWWDMIQLLPSSYNQKRTIMLNYMVLCNIYKSRVMHRHKLDEWCDFGSWIKELPYSEIITEPMIKKQEMLLKNAVKDVIENGKLKK